MKTENLTHAEAVQAMMDGYEVVSSDDCVYKIEKQVIQIKPKSGGSIPSNTFFEPGYTFRIKISNQRKLKKTFYRAHFLTPEKFIATSFWYASENTARKAVLSSTIIEIETRDFMMPE